MKKTYIQEIQLCTNSLLSGIQNNMKLHSLITATDLKQWADSKDCQTYLPSLVKDLIRATNYEIEFIHIPCVDSTHLAGFDGIVCSSKSLHNVPKGKSVWEFGCDKNIRAKANKDYKKRTQENSGCDCKETTFVFVTPREWSSANNWMKQKNDESIWKNVVVITAIELEDWISLYPNIGLSLAHRLNKTPDFGVVTAKQWWNRWAFSEKYCLNQNILLAGREREQIKVIDCCKTSANIFLSASSYDEGIAFIIA